MTTTANLALALIETNQSQKEVVMNAAITAFENALTESTDIECDDGTVIVSGDDARESVHLQLTTGSLSAAFVVQLPAIKRLIIVTNATSYDATVVCADAPTGAEEVEVFAGKSGILYNSGTAVHGMTAAAPSAPSTLLEINAQTGTTYELELTDAGKLLTCDNGSDITVTVPAEGDVAFEVGTQILIAQLDAGQVTVVEGATAVTIITPETTGLAKVGATASLIKIAADTWLMAGNLEAA